ncbi:MAG TPA: glycolate oxidase subunit GlcF [Rhizomicrobium sp.]
MRTHFRAEQLADPALAVAEKNLRACVHCGICTATCPTYVLLGDERDSPRGRIVMMQQMLEAGGAPTPETVHHLDRCLSCLGCRTACPSGVDYARLIDQSRTHIQQHYRRPITDRLLRWTIANVLTRPAFTRAALRFARLASPLSAFLPRRMRNLADVAIATPVGRLKLRTVAGERRIALLPGCVQQVVAPEIDEAVARLLARRGISLVPLSGAACCGALAHHLGREVEAKAWATRMIEAFERAGGSDMFEGILITATGCAAHIHEHDHLFLGEPDWRARAKTFSAKLMPLEALIGTAKGTAPSRLRVALQVPCSQQHGLGWPDDGTLLREAGFEVLPIPEGHLCCGSAGSYSILQPEIANALRDRKLGNIRSVKPDLVATSNVGCLQHLSGPDAPPIVHIAELLDWAEGGPTPKALRARGQLMAVDEAVG